MPRHTVRLSFLFALILLLPALASAQQSISVNIGYFDPRGEDSRVRGDVLVENLNYHIFDLNELGNATISGEWLFPIGDFIEGGAGVGYFSSTIPSIYRDWVNEDGSEIAQDFKLRVVPISATVRFLPLGRGAAVQPYVGAGVGVFVWRYTETGEFVAADGSIFRDRFEGDGTEVGPVVFGGVRFPVAHTFAIGAEMRYQRAEGQLDPNSFNGDRIDLSGITWSAVLQFRF
ncbi:MAG: hypothetical protein H6Q10_503 [Acidobacteria bacterium]|nr:hypothetical protein [Acidobacteriota bacterium]